MTRVALGMGTRAAQFGLAKLTTQNPQALSSRLLFDQAKILAEQLGELKGSVMKVGQMLSVYGEHFLPPETNALLKSLQFSSPPLAWVEIQKILLAELGSKKLQQLEFDDQPYASASIGQVHLATIKATNQRVAVKIQYPGVADAIDTDLAFLRQMFRLAELFPSIPQMESIFTEVKEMFEQEIDYRFEFGFINHFRQRLSGDSRYVMPETYAEFSTAKILTTSFEKGFTIDSPAVQNLSLEDRNYLAESIMDLYYRELFLWGEVQTDPHQGNYRIRIGEERPKLVLFDFGATRKLSDHFLFHYRRMIKAVVGRDETKTLEHARALNFFGTSVDPRLLQIFLQFCELLAEPFNPPTSSNLQNFARTGEYLWAQSDMPKRLASKTGEVFAGFELQTPPRELVFLDRKTAGMFILLGMLKAQWNPRSTFDRYTDFD